jgi:hypothetical protein
MAFKFKGMLRIIRRPLEVVLLRYIFALMVLIPLTMWLVWLLKPAKPFNIYILDKTVGGLEYRKHASLYWILINDKIVKPDGNAYSPESDYYGFFRLSDSTYTTRGVDKLTRREADSLALTLDAVYIADTYGVYYNDFYSPPKARNTLLYGGLYERDLDLMEGMKAQGKLVIAEFNCLGESTPRNAKKRFEEEFGVVSTGWSGRFFDSLDSTRQAGLPAWIFKLHRKKTGKNWPYTSSGIVLVHNRGDILVLESGDGLQRGVPVVKTPEKFQEKFQVPESVEYTFWFDVVYSKTGVNQTVSVFELPVTEKGDSLLHAYKLNAVFPAVIGHLKEDYSFYYFAGDFSDNPVDLTYSRFRGIELFQTFFYNPRDVLDRRAFFWRYYRPLVGSILETAAGKLVPLSTS